MGDPATAPANPWVDLPPKPPWVLPSDRPLLERHNLKCDDVHRLRFDVPPEPFVGDQDAPVVFLNLNPGFDDEGPAMNARPSIQALVRANLAHDMGATRYPLYHLHPEYSGTCTSRWWDPRMRWLIEAVGRERVAQGVFIVELFGYPSRRYRTPPWVPSQDYSVALVKRALERGATLLVLRAYSKWITAVPDLAQYDNLYRLSNPQGVWVSPRNCPEGFQVIAERLATTP